MSGAGAPSQNLLPEFADYRVAVVVSTWHDQIMDGLIDGAERALAAANVTDFRIIRVPGSFEIPVVARAAALAGFDAIVALGAVIKGGTPHFEYVCQGVTYGITKVSTELGVPIGNGVLTCNTVEEAIDRAGLPGSHEDKGFDATAAALTTARILVDLRDASTTENRP
ncbi:MAG TPA: 6,7-dimethyl-8-ribityllumazine synthase [Candidatus Nanopelagicaceae bacterium]|nr:6,7-dimethyl-8-ribityllumazine synthase [Candidatus Nanopelagicaceae bacterium]